jgi:hypothetical protein
VKLTIYDQTQSHDCPITIDTGKAKTRDGRKPRTFGELKEAFFAATTTEGGAPDYWGFVVEDGRGNLRQPEPEEPADDETLASLKRVIWAREDLVEEKWPGGSTAAVPPRSPPPAASRTGSYAPGSYRIDRTTPVASRSSPPPAASRGGAGLPPLAMFALVLCVIVFGILPFFSTMSSHNATPSAEAPTAGESPAAASEPASRPARASTASREARPRGRRCCRRRSR